MYTHDVYERQKQNATEESWFNDDDDDDDDDNTKEKKNNNTPSPNAGSIASKHDDEEEDALDKFMLELDKDQARRKEAQQQHDEEERIYADDITERDDELYRSLMEAHQKEQQLLEGDDDVDLDQASRLTLKVPKQAFVPMKRKSKEVASHDAREDVESEDEDEDEDEDPDELEARERVRSCHTVTQLVIFCYVM